MPNQNDIRSLADTFLKRYYGKDASFRDGQYEAIEAVLNNKRTLVIQKTGWGKSLVYFICTKILRSQKKGVTLIVSPLLSLMDNQLEAAKKLKLKCEALNSNKDAAEKSSILDNMVANKYDIIFITPETLQNPTVKNCISKTKIGLFVIDEAHCISDWGHDFRLEYSKLGKIVSEEFKDIPVLATTATANDRVIDDIKKQLGEDLFLLKGSIMRKSLSIQVLKLDDKAARYGWILENIENLLGSGIIYCLTRDDCDDLAVFLQKNGINVRPYHSGIDNKTNSETEQLFFNNKLKAIVATIKMGMGYDKNDISFIIHFHTPSNIVTYYQQIGRAGRNIDRAYTFLMCGKDDANIHNYFIDTAFPLGWEVYEIIKCIRNYNPYSANYSLNADYLKSQINISHSRLLKALRFLENENVIYMNRGSYHLKRNVRYTYNREHYDEVAGIRRNEQEQMQRLTQIHSCYARFTAKCLNDDEAEDCLICSNCLGYDEFPSEVSEEVLQRAQEYLNSFVLPIEPIRISNADNKHIYPLKEGLCLSKYGDTEYGKMVQKGKYKDKRFCDELLEKSADVLKRFVEKRQITALTFVPSLRSNVVKDFAERLAEKLGLPIMELLIKKDAEPQKKMQNAKFQYTNALNSFEIIEGGRSPQNVLLVDDVFDSKWTLTVCGDILYKNGASNVYPFTLAKSTTRGEE